MNNQPIRARRITVLLVDDQLIIGKAVEQMLAAEQDIDFHFCQDPTLALKLANQVEPTVILQDLVMPEMPGLALVRYFRANPSTRDVPLIVLSTKEEPDIKAQAFRSGANDYLVKLPDRLELAARIRYHSQSYINLLQKEEALTQLEKTNRFIRQVFGRYLSEEVVDSLLESPDGLRLGGEKRLVTVLMSDLRGFTSISERLAAEDVMSIVNHYLAVMTEIILKYQGIINEFTGDGILAIFGAPIQRDDDAERAVACGLEMQRAIAEVNRYNQTHGYPEVAMGIGINTGELVVGNIGSKKRAKYGVVGRTVNLASRIESYTVGGQLLISASTATACGPILRIDSQMEVLPKGVQNPITLSEVGGIAGKYSIFLPEKQPPILLELPTPVALTFSILEDKHASAQEHTGRMIKLCENHAEIEANTLPVVWDNLKIRLYGGNVLAHNVALADEDSYAKVIEAMQKSPPCFRIIFTSMPPAVKTWLAQRVSSI